MRHHRVESLLDDLWRLSPARMAEFLTQGRFQRYHHIRFLDKILMERISRGNARLVVSMPPRHGKSWLSSLYTPAWFLSLWPNRNVILTSYEASFAASWGRLARDFIHANKSTLEARLSPDSSASDRWNTSEGGGMVTAGIGGPITGRGGHLIVVDDPIKNWEEAISDTYQQKTIDWFNSTLYTRAEPGASIVVLMTRWHERDLAGYLLAEHQDPWVEVRLPATAEENDPLGRRPGEPLCPQRFDKEALEKMRKAVGSRVWSALYQQRPTIEQGGIIKRSWLKYWKFLPEQFDEQIQVWDLTFKDSTNCDYVVGQVWGKKGADRFLIDQVRERMDFPATIQAVKLLSAKHPLATAKIIEDKANGPAVIASLKRELGGLIPYSPKDSKEARLHSVSPEIEAGNVFFPHSSIYPWSNDLTEELCSFPNGRYDDQVDAVSLALIRFQQHGSMDRLRKLCTF